jgi:TolB protein
MRRPISSPTIVPALTLAVLSALGMLGACDGDPTGIVGPDNALIAFSTNPEGVSPDVAREIFVMRPDGSDVTQLTDGMLATQPAWSPDGSMIAFARLAAGDRNIYLMDADGADIRALTTGLQARFNPTWAPEGDRVLFVQGNELYTVDLEGGDPVLLHRCDSPGCQWPDWSPDGDRIAFVGWPGSFPLVHLLTLDGSDPTLLGTGLEYEHMPVWAPDGGSLLLTGRLPEGGFGLVLASPDGQILATLPEEAQRQRSQASFSRDGSSILYYEEPFAGDGEAGIYVMASDGSDARPIRAFPRDLDHWVYPAWRP